MWWMFDGAASARTGADPYAACRDGADEVRFASGLVEVPLLRGPNTASLPAVAATVTRAADPLPTLVVLDLAGGCSRIDPATANALGLVADGGLVVLDSLTIGGFALDGVRVVVDPTAPGLVLGVPSVPELAVALLPSEGSVVFGGESEADAVLARVGAPVQAGLPPKKSGNGLTLRVPGALRWGPVAVDGTFDVRTDLVASLVAPSPRLPEPALRGGLPSYDVGARLGDVWLVDTWIRLDPSVTDPSPDHVGALGYDVLFAVDLAVAPARRALAFRAAPQDRSTDATEAAVAAATQRYEAEERKAANTPNATLAPTDPRASVSFDGPRENVIPLGNPGNPVVRDRNLVLADTLWRAGRLDEALPRYYSAAQYAGDHCGAHLDLAERRMAWTGQDRLTKDLVRKLIEDPLEQAALLWKTWSGLDPALRDAVRAGNAPAGSVQVVQPEACAIVVGLLHRIHSTAGDPRAQALEREHPRDPTVGWSRLLALLDSGQYGPADALFPVSEGGAPALWRQLAELRLAAGLRQPSRADPLLKAVPGTPTSMPLVAALLALDAATLTSDPSEWTRKLLRQDPRWVPGQLVHALASGEKPAAWDPSLEAREPGSPQVRCQKAVHAALLGDVATARKLLQGDRRVAEPDWWAANAVVDHLSGERAARDRDLVELKVRFPLLPVDRLGLRDPAP